MSMYTVYFQGFVLQLYLFDMLCFIFTAKGK